MKVRVNINGTNKNVWHVMGFNANPFPAIAKHEFNIANAMLRRLDSDPIENTDQIREILKGCDQDFIDLCCRRFVLGERVSFEISWPD